jgi:hypothetical protein
MASDPLILCFSVSISGKDMKNRINLRVDFCRIFEAHLIEQVLYGKGFRRACPAFDKSRNGNGNNQKYD